MDAIRISRLTDRQQSCLRYVHAHLSSKEIATRLGIEPGTVDQHIKAAMLVLGVSDRREAAQLLVGHEGASSDRPDEGAPDHGADEAVAAIRHGLRNILNFSGRDTPGQFWPYAMFLLLLGWTILFFLIEPPLLIATMRIKELAAESGVSSTQLQSEYPSLLPDLSHFPLVLGAVTLVHFALIAAAIARRRHDWRPRELWGYLPLPVANAVLVVLPVIILPLPAVTAIVGCIYAIIRGGAPERIAAILVLTGSFITTVGLALAYRFPGGVEVALLVLDLVTLAIQLLLALLANRIWPIWVAAISALGAAAHVITATNSMVLPGAYGVVAALGFYPVFVLLMIGTFNHRRRLRLYGADLAWTPLAQLRRPARD